MEIFIALVVAGNFIQLYLNEKGAVYRGKALADRLREIENKFESEIDNLKWEIKALELNGAVDEEIDEHS
tara:strand:+ start:212 stop:421 length:210 start_codon:yes stop_codon:yes gene_type:complete